MLADLWVGVGAVRRVCVCARVCAGVRARCVIEAVRAVRARTLAPARMRRARARARVRANMCVALSRASERMCVRARASERVSSRARGYRWIIGGL